MAAHERSRGTYGAEKSQEELADADGIQVGIPLIKRIRRKHNLRCKQLKKYKTTGSQHNPPVAPNRLNQNFAVADRIGSGLPTSTEFWQED